MRRATAAVLTLVAGAGCGDQAGESTSNGDRGAGVGALGAGARVETLARASLRSPPPNPAVWVADEFRLRPGRAVTRGGDFAFVYARVGRLSLQLEGAQRTLAAGEAAPAPARTRRVYRAGEPGSAAWEIRLARRGSPVPDGARRIFESEPLEGIPERAALSFLSVTVPPRGGRTTVHTHPGPELVYELSGTIDYQNALIGTRRLRPGGLEGIPPDTPVQKRNPYRKPAVFLSWFAVDPSRPFAPAASF
jgi:quercetin dioxygenase-like cupin family protein